MRAACEGQGSAGRVTYRGGLLDVGWKVEEHLTVARCVGRPSTQEFASSPAHSARAPCVVLRFLRSCRSAEKIHCEYRFK